MPNEKVFQGKTASGGIAIAPLHIRDTGTAAVERHVDDAQTELERLEKAQTAVRERLEKAASGLDAKNADILNAQILMLDDESFLREIRERITKDAVNAETAVCRAGGETAARFEEMENEYLRARSADIRDIAQKLIDELSGGQSREMPTEPSILIAEEITPEEIASMDRSLVLAIVTRKGAAASHAAIMAANFGIPYIFGIDCSAEELREIDCAAVDGDHGRLILSPDEATLLALREAARASESVCDYHGRTRLYANIAGPEDVEAVLQAGADGIGLYRTEFLYMNRDSLPDEDTQFEAYKSVMERMGGREVIIRTMDVGADKPAACLHLAEEPNPALGRRAIRICLDNPDLFRTQLRALLRAACCGNAKIMFPMIASPWEIDEIFEQVNLAAEELKQRGVDYTVPPLGIMVETPSAAVLSDVLARKVAFFSIGTNDLTQYTLALDRNGESMDRYYQADAPSVLRLIEMIVKNAHDAGIEVGICGELAGKADAIAKLVEIDVDELSMAPAKLPKARRILAELAAKKAPEKVNEEFGAPADGRLIPMEEIPDETFAQGILGRCVGVEPENGCIYAPCDGEITMIAETKHAITLKSDQGSELLVHVGIDTVKLNGKGFDCHVREGQRVRRGDLIMNVDLRTIRDAGLPTITVLVLTGQ